MVVRRVIIQIDQGHWRCQQLRLVWLRVANGWPQAVLQGCACLRAWSACQNDCDCSGVRKPSAKAVLVQRLVCNDAEKHLCSAIVRAEVRCDAACELSLKSIPCSTLVTQRHSHKRQRLLHAWLEPKLDE
jgi:hypothetical protein